jgi:hypothetical protein
VSIMTIPALHPSDQSKASGAGQVLITTRTAGGTLSGVFTVRVDAHFDPAVDDYPTGSLEIRTDLSDSLRATFDATSIEIMTSYGKHNPTVYMTGRCKATQAIGTAPPPKGLRYWVMIADNRGPNATSGTPDVAAFAIHDNLGNRVAYGAGPLRTGNIAVVAE